MTGDPSVKWPTRELCNSSSNSDLSDDCNEDDEAVAIAQALAQHPAIAAALDHALGFEANRF